MGKIPNNKTFCVRPFLQYSSFNDQYFRLCCSAYEGEKRIHTQDIAIESIFNSDYMKGVREKMTSGQDISECRGCYQLEEKGIESDRLVANKGKWHEYHGEILDSIQNDYISVGPRTLDLRVGNVCNLKCQSCYPNLSVGVYDDVKTIFKSKPELRPLTSPRRRLASGFSLEQVKAVTPNLRELKIIGGEPTFSEEARELLDYLIESGLSSQINLDLHTNLTNWNELFFKKLLQFKKVSLGLSMDGMGMTNDYLRYPSSWKNVEQNFSKILAMYDREPNILLKVTPVVQISNILSIPELLNYLVEKNSITRESFRLSPIVLVDPDYYSIYNLPQVVIKNAQENFNLFYETKSSEQKEFLHEFYEIYNSLNKAEYNAKQINRYIEVTKMYDKARGHNILDIFPEFKELITGNTEAL